MKFTCDRNVLTEAINISQKAVATRSTLPVLEGLLIKANDGKVVITGNDLEIGIECILEAEIEYEGSIVVNSRLFGDIIRKMTGDVISIDVNSNNVTNIKCGNSKFNITGIEATEFPEINRFDVEYDITLTQKQLKELVRHTIFAVGTNESKMILTGCLLEASGNNVNMVAVDGFRLAYKKITCESDAVSGFMGDVSLVIPAKSLNELVKIIDDSDDEVKIHCSEKNVRFDFNNVIFTSRLLEGDYIDYKKIIPSDYRTTIKTGARTFIEAVERASLIITSEVTKSPIIMNIVDAEVKINCETQVGKVEEFIPVDMTGDSIEIGFNNRYLLDALKAVSTDEIKFSFIGSTSPCLISPVEGDDFKYIVLPVRLKTE